MGFKEGCDRRNVAGVGDDAIAEQEFRARHHDL